MKHYAVISPSYESYSNGYEPPESGSDVAIIEAEDPQDAIHLALKTKEMKGWLEEARSNLISPFAGVRVENCLCVHGKCFCGYCANEDCPDCEAMDRIMESAGVI